jgi:hypothetical protein
MARYVQRPVVVDARQYTEDNGPELAEWVTNNSKEKQIGLWFEQRQFDGQGVAIRLNAEFAIMDRKTGDQDFVSPGWWVLQIDDEFFTYTDMEFQKRFEKA